MRLGRKLAEGFAVDHEADRASAGHPGPVAEPAAPAPESFGAGRTEPVHTEPVQTEPARSGPRAAD